MTNPASTQPDGTPPDFLVAEVPQALRGVPTHKLGLPHLNMRLVRLAALTLADLGRITCNQYLRASGSKEEDIQAIREAFAALAGLPPPPIRVRPVPPARQGVLFEDAVEAEDAPEVFPGGLAEALLDIPIDGLGLVPATRNALVGYGFSTVRDLHAMTERGFVILCPQLGIPTLTAIRDAVMALGRAPAKPVEQAVPTPLSVPKPLPVQKPLPIRSTAPAPVRRSGGMRLIAEGMGDILAGIPLDRLDLKPRLMRIVTATGVKDVGHLCNLPESSLIDAGGDRFGLLSLRHAIEDAAALRKAISSHAEAETVVAASDPVTTAAAAADEPSLPDAVPLGSPSSLDPSAPILPDAAYTEAFLDIALADLSLHPWTRGALRQMGCTTIRDLRGVTRKQYLSCIRAGKRSLEVLTEAVEALLLRHGIDPIPSAEARLPAPETIPAAAPSITEPDAYALDTPVLPLIEADLAALETASSAVIGAALGLNGMDLSHPTDAHACTGAGERAALEDCAKGSIWRTPLTHHLLGLAYRAPVLLSCIAARPWARGLTEIAVARLVNLLASPEACVFESRGSDAFGSGKLILAPLPRKEWEVAVDRAWGVVECAEGKGMAEDVAGPVWDSLHPHPLHVRMAVIEAVFHGRCRLDTARSLVSPGEMRDTVREVLRASSEPMPKAAVASGLAEALGVAVSDERLSGTLEEVAYYAQRGYGSLAAIEAAGGSAKIAHAVLGVMAKSQLIRWPLERLSTSLFPRIRIAPDDLRHALEGDPRFTWHGQVAISAARRGPPAQQSLQSAAASVLSDAGRPMSVRDLVKALMKVRGEARLPAEDGHVFRLDAHRWGLVERDIPVPDACIRACVAAVGSLDLMETTSLRQVLDILQRTVKGSEVLKEDWLGAVLRSTGDYEIGSRKTVRRTSPAPLAPNVVNERVQGVLTGRFPDERTVRNALMANGVADGHGTEATWTLRGGDAPPTA